MSKGLFSKEKIICFVVVLLTTKPGGRGAKGHSGLFTKKKKSFSGFPLFILKQFFPKR